MEYRLLGPLEVLDGSGHKLPLGGVRQQTVLASLLLRAGQTVGLERLVDEVWEEPPATAARTVQAYVSRLRHELREGAIESRPGGYALVLDDDELDLRVFEQSAEEGRRALAAGNCGQAAELLRQALALRRGPALAGLTSEALGREAERLEELRLHVVEDRIEADLECGREREIVPELQALVQEHPFRERPRAQLMLALYRSGRQADALAFYRETRSLLAEELGLEPSQELRELERAILRGDPSLELLNQTNLPIAASPLVGRSRELAELLELLGRDDVRLLTMTGPGGTGKTRLALEAATHAVGDYENGVIWVSLAPLRDPALVLESVGRALSARRALVEEIGEKSLLLLLDNFEQVVEAAPALAELLGSCRNLNLLVTSRQPLHLAGEREYPVPPLAESDAVALFNERAQAVLPEFSGNGEVVEICLRLDGLPLAIELAAARVKVLPPRALLERLEPRLPLLTGGARDAPERQRTLRATIAWSYELLDEEEKRLFARLAVFSGGFTIEAAEEVCEAELDTLQSLLDKSLLRRRNGRFWMLETIREYAVERLETLPEAEQMRRAQAQYVAALGEQTHGTSRPSWSRDTANFRAALAWARGADECELVVRLATVAGEFVLRPAEVVTLIHDALAEADMAPTPLVAAAREAAGDALYHMGDPKGARREYEASLVAVSSDNDHLHIELLTRLAWTTHMDGDLATARERWEHALLVAAQVEDARCTLAALHGLGELAVDEGDIARATELLEQSIGLAMEQGDPYEAAGAVHGLGDLALATGNLNEAERHYQEGLRRADALDYRDIIVSCVGGLAAVAAERRDLDSAGQLWGIHETLEQETGFSLMDVRRKKYEQRIATCAARNEASFGRAAAKGRASGRAALATLLA